MPDISNKGSHAYWYKYTDPMIYRVLTFMEGVEDWTYDGDEELEKALTKLGETMDDIANVDLKNEDEFIAILAYLKAGRTLFIMQSMDTAHPGSASKLLMHAEEETLSDDDLPGLFLRRNLIFERLRLLGRVFAEERIQLILNALEGSND